MRAPSVLSILIAASLLLVGCTGTSDAAQDGDTPQVPSEATTASTPVSDSPPAPEVRQIGDPCENARGVCEAVAAVDVDGDNELDDVGVELVDGRIVVWIDTGSGLESIDVEDKHIVRTDVTPTGVFVGAFEMTRPFGADLVVDTKFGLGGYELFAVVGWDDGPILVPAPEGARAPEGAASEWAFPTEAITVLARCPEPGSVEILTSEGDVRYGVPVPGGAYTETITSRWSDGDWASTTTDRVAGETERTGRVAKTSTFECDPLNQAPRSAPSGSGEEDSVLVLGGTGPSNSQGYGEARPPVVYFGGSPSGMIYDIEWQEWGGDQAEGQGTAGFVEPGGIVADAIPMTAEIVAFDVTDCDGTRAYSRVHWYFPSQGESFDPTLASGVC